MKKTILSASLAAVLLAAAPALAAEVPAAKGGRLAATAEMHMELVTRGEALELYLTDHAGKPLPAAGWTGKAVLLVSGQKVEVPLSPAEGNLLRGSVAGGAAPVATIVSLTGGPKPQTARFAADPKAKAADPVLALGRTVYAENCAACHGERLEGQPNWQSKNAEGRFPAPPLTDAGHAWKHADADLLTAIKESPAALMPAGYQTDMPAFKDVLKPAEIEAVLTYVKSHWSPAMAAQQPKQAAPKAMPAADPHAGHH